MVGIPITKISFPRKLITFFILIKMILPLGSAVFITDIKTLEKKFTDMMLKSGEIIKWLLEKYTLILLNDKMPMIISTSYFCSFNKLFLLENSFNFRMSIKNFIWGAGRLNSFLKNMLGENAKLSKCERGIKILYGSLGTTKG